MVTFNAGAVVVGNMVIHVASGAGAAICGVHDGHMRGATREEAVALGWCSGCRDTRGVELLYAPSIRQAIVLVLTPEEALSTAAALTFALEVVGEGVATPSTIRAVLEKLRAAGVKE